MRSNPTWNQAQMRHNETKEQAESTKNREGSQSASDGSLVLVGDREAAACLRTSANTPSTACRPPVNQSHRLILKTSGSCG